jgi:hypothetical protein
MNIRINCRKNIEICRILMMKRCFKYDENIRYNNCTDLSKKVYSETNYNINFIRLLLYLNFWISQQQF